jgi:hypothetical protein
VTKAIIHPETWILFSPEFGDFVDENEDLTNLDFQPM